MEQIKKCKVISKYFPQNILHRFSEQMSKRNVHKTRVYREGKSKVGGVERAGQAVRGQRRSGGVK